MSEHNTADPTTARHLQRVGVLSSTLSLRHQPSLQHITDNAVERPSGSRRARIDPQRSHAQRPSKKKKSRRLDSTTGALVQSRRKRGTQDEEIVIELPRQIGAGAMHDRQMLSSFLHLYVPSARDDSIDQLTYTQFLPDLVNSTPLLKISCDALCFAFLGSIYDDERLKLRAVKSYAWAIWFMRTCVFPDTTSKSLQKDTILASLILLAHCEVHECIAVPGKIGPNDAFLAHLNGAQAFFEVNRDEILSTPFGKALCASLRSNAYLIGFLKRKPVRHSFGAPDAISTRPQDQPLLDLNDIAIEIPTLLQMRDRLLDNPTRTPSAARLKQLARGVIDMRDRFIDVFAKHYGDGRGLRFGDISEAPTFARFWGDRSTVFNRIYVFDSYRLWAHYSGYWSMLWELDVMLLELGELTTPSNVPSLTLTEVLRHDAILKEAHLCAANLCRAFPASCEPDHVVFSPLRSSSGNRMRDFFKKYGYLEELKWIDDLSSMVASAGTSWDVQCKFGHLSKQPVARIAGSLDAWERE